MYPIKLPNAAGSTFGVTTTPQSVLSLIEAAAGAEIEFTDEDIAALDAIDIVPEDGNLRYLADGNIPSSSNGVRLEAEGLFSFRGTPVTKMQIVSESGTVNTSIQIGFSNLPT